MTKRQRDTRLTREQLEAGDYGEEDDVQQTSVQAQVANMATLQQRKIVKVKRHIQQTGEVQTTVPTKTAQFKFAGALSGTTAQAPQPAAAAKPTFSFGSGAPAKVEEPKAPAKQEAKPEVKKFQVASAGTFGGVKINEAPKQASLFGGQAPAGGLFGAKPVADSNATQFKPISGGTFGGKKLPVKEEAPKPAADSDKKDGANDASKTQEAPKPVGSLFGAPVPPTGGSLFGNLNTVKQQEADPAKKGSLFGNPLPSTSGTQKFGLFGNQAADKDAEAAKPAQTSLFGSSAPAKPAGSLFGAPTSGGLFGSKPPSGGSLFGGAAPSSGGLFGAASSGPSLFGAGAAASKPADKSVEKSDNEDDNGEEEGEKSPPIYADNAKVEFKGAGAQQVQPSPYTKVFSKQVNTFKIIKPEEAVRKMTNCEVSLEFAETDGKKVYLVVVRQAKKVLIQGSVNAKVSRSRRVEEKSAKNQLKLAMQLTIDAKKQQADGSSTTQKKIVFPFCCINFCRQEEMANFETEFTKAVADLKKAAEAK